MICLFSIIVNYYLFTFLKNENKISDEPGDGPQLQQQPIDLQHSV